MRSIQWVARHRGRWRARGRENGWFGELSNPDYWYRAYFRKQFSSAEPAVKALQAKLQKTLGAGKGFGGDESAGDLRTIVIWWHGTFRV